MLRRRRVLCLGAIALAGCQDGSQEATPETGPGPASDGENLAVSSLAFGDGESIPTRFTGAGENVSPPLEIDGVPDSAAALALRLDDPDAPDPPFTHWLCWAIPPDTTEIPEGLPDSERLDALGGAIQGRNDAGELGYTGPMPPAGDGPHRYRFAVAALDSSLGLPPGAERAAFDDALDGLVLARGELVGTYQRE